MKKRSSKSLLNFNNATFFIAKFGISSVTITGLPIVPIIAIKISPQSTLDRLLMFIKSDSLI